MGFRPMIAARPEADGRAPLHAAADGARERKQASGGTDVKTGLGARLIWILQRSLPALVFVALIAIWWAAGAIFGAPAYLLPPPQDVLPRLVTSRVSLWNHSLVTLQEIVLGFALSIVTAIPLGPADCAVAATRGRSSIRR